MKIKRYLLSTFCLCLFTACDSDDNLLCYGTHTEIEGDVTTFGAVGDGKTDCSKAINSAIASLPSEGGVVVIPEGDFVLDAPKRRAMELYWQLGRRYDPPSPSRPDSFSTTCCQPDTGDKRVLNEQ
mgnify:CR=1 FL=1